VIGRICGSCLDSRVDGALQATRIAVPVPVPPCPSLSSRLADPVKHENLRHGFAVRIPGRIIDL
jgi:hypothetical protein